MNCSVCGKELPQGASICPHCGSVVASMNPAQYDPTQMASYMRGVDPAQYDPTRAAPYAPSRVSTNYGVDPYGAAPPPPVPYASGNYPNQPPPPYVAPMPYAAPPPRQNRGLVIGLIAGVSLLLLLLGGGLLVLLSHNATTQQSSQQNATSTPAADPSRNPYAPNTGTLVLSDPLHDNSKGYRWDEATMNGKTNGDTSVCGFKNGAYHITRTPKDALICNPEAPSLVLSNVTFEASLTIVQGDQSGVAVRFDQTKGVGYLFSISTTGYYGIDKVDFNNANAPYIMLRSGSNKAIKTGLNQTNLLALVANGSTLSAYVNGVFVDSTQDSSYTTGQPGLFGNGINSAEDITASNARVWKL